jgi:hypothetical protein
MLPIMLRHNEASLRGRQTVWELEHLVCLSHKPQPAATQFSLLPSEMPHGLRKGCGDDDDDDRGDALGLGSVDCLTVVFPASQP